jgi:hypothetical protein
MRLLDHVTLNSNNNMSTASVFVGIEKAFNTTWHSGLLYKLPELEFSTSVIELIAFYLTDRKFRVLVEGEAPTPRKMAAGVPQGSVHAPTLCGLYTCINEAPAAPGTHLSLFTDDTCIYVTETHERCVLCKLQRGLTAMKSWCER